MSLIWTSQMRSAVCRASENGYPDEVCGLLVGERVGDNRIVRAVLPVANAWEETGEHRRRFRIAPDDFVRAERQARAEGREILGFYHSHPDHEPVPSETDREYAWPLYSYVIQSVHRGISLAVHSWLLKSDRSGYDEEVIIVQE